MIRWERPEHQTDEIVFPVRAAAEPRSVAMFVVMTTIAVAFCVGMFFILLYGQRG